MPKENVKYLKIPVNLIVVEGDEDDDEEEFDEELEEDEDSEEIDEGTAIKITRMDHSSYLHLYDDMNEYLMLHGVVDPNVFKGIMGDKEGNMLPAGTLVPINYFDPTDEIFTTPSRYKSITMVRLQLEDPLFTGLENIDKDKDRCTRPLQVYLYFKLTYTGKSEITEDEKDAIIDNLLNELDERYYYDLENTFFVTSYYYYDGSGKSKKIPLTIDYLNLFKKWGAGIEIVDDIPSHFII